VLGEHSAEAGVLREEQLVEGDSERARAWGHFPEGGLEVFDQALVGAGTFGCAVVGHQRMGRHRAARRWAGSAWHGGGRGWLRGGLRHEERRPVAGGTREGGPYHNKRKRRIPAAALVGDLELATP